MTDSSAVTSETLLRAHELRAKDEEFRRKERDLAKREQQLKVRLEEADKAREQLEKAQVAVDMREAAIAELERRHGTLTEYEQSLMQRERTLEIHEAEFTDLTNNFETLKAEHDFYFKAKEKDFVERMIPMAQREQELCKKEAEIALMSADTETQHKALLHRIETQEEWFNRREKATKEAESRVHEALLRTERRQYELTQQYNDTQERLKLLKCEQTEIESRDRDVKWKEQQHYTAQMELREKERKLYERVLELNSVKDTNDTMAAELELRMAELELARQEMNGKQQRLLIAQADLKEREKDLDARWEDCRQTNERAEQREKEAAELAASLAGEHNELANKISAVGARYETMLAREQEINQRSAMLDQAERELLEWMQELMAQQAMGHPLMDGGGGGGGSGGGSVLPNAPIPAQGNNGSVIRMQLRKIQQHYIASTAKREVRTQRKSEKDSKAFSLLDLRDWDVVGIVLDAETRDQALEEEVQQLLTLYHSYVFKFPNLLNDNNHSSDQLFTEKDRETIVRCHQAEQSSLGEYTFLLELLNSPLSQRLNTTSELQLANSMTVWYKKVRDLAYKREIQVLRDRKERLEKAVLIFTTRESQHPTEFPHRLSPLWNKAATNLLAAQQRKRVPNASVLQRLTQRGANSDKVQAIATQRVLAILDAKTAAEVRDKEKWRKKDEKESLPGYLRKCYTGSPVDPGTIPVQSEGGPLSLPPLVPPPRPSSKSQAEE